MPINPTHPLLHSSSILYALFYQLTTWLSGSKEHSHPENLGSNPWYYSFSQYYVNVWAFPTFEVGFTLIVANALIVMGCLPIEICTSVFPSQIIGTKYNSVIVFEVL